MDMDVEVKHANIKYATPIVIFKKVVNSLTYYL